MGSKDKVVPKLSLFLPKAENFYDLFGGGFAVSHFMALHKKYKYVHYNEIESSTVKLVQDAIAGKYNYNVFKPKWISREEFNLHDAYIRIIWSFGNNQKDYIFGKDIEEHKRSLHQAVIFNEFNDTAKKILGINKFPEELSIIGRRLFIRHKNKLNNPKLKPQQLEQLQQLQQLQQLERLQQLEQTITFSSMSYEQVEIKPNSIIYCDPPYKNTGSYIRPFDHDKFWDWARNNPHPVYISEYKAPKDFKLVTAISHKKNMSSKGMITDSMEMLYCNKAAERIRNGTSI